MKVIIFNFVRKIYWKDRENIELEMLSQYLSPFYEVDMITISEDMVEKMRRYDFLQGNIYITMLDFNADEMILNSIFKISELIKKKNSESKIILLGNRAYLHANQILEECKFINYIIGGDVESCIETILGICNQKQTYPKIIDENVDSKYKMISPLRNEEIVKELKIAKIRTTRGCNGNCLFCIDKGKNGISNIRNMEEVVLEIEDIMEKYEIKKFCFYDNSFEDPDYVTKHRIKEFLEIVKRKNLQAYFECSVRAESFKTESDLILLKEMSKLGFYKIIVGFESGFQNDLVFFQKRATVVDNLRIAQFLQESNINYIMPPGFIMFHPFTTRESLTENYKFLKKIGKGYSMLAICSFLKVFPGSRMHKILLKEHISDEKVSYKELVPYTYKSEEVCGFADFLYKVRYTSKTVEVAMSIDNMQDLLMQVKKGFTVWEDVEEFEESIITLKNKVTNLVENFFENCVMNLSDMSYIAEKYRELEGMCEQIDTYSGMKRFVKKNITNNELQYLI